MTMTTEMTITQTLPIKPDWLVPGAIVRVQFWVGQVEEVAISEKHIMVLVSSPKGIWRNHPAEWLEFKPEHIRLATPVEIAEDLERHRKYITKMLTDLDVLREKWQIEMALEAQ
jgi:hypothetical protein